MQMTMWFHKLAMAEQLLEGCVAGLMGLGYKDLPLMYSELKKGAVQKEPSRGTQRMWEVCGSTKDQGYR